MSTVMRDGLPTPARYRALAVIIVGVTMSALDGSIVNLALPGIARDLRSSAAGSVWVVSAYQLAALALLLPLASLGDRVGYRQVYLGGAAIFAIASAVCCIANSVPMLAMARGVQGMGAAGIMAVNGALLRLTYPKKQFGRGIAINSAIIAAASVAGPAVAAAILSVASWHWLFAANIPLGLLLVVLGWRALPQNTLRAAGGMHLAWQDVALNALMFGLFFVGAQSLGHRSDVGPAPVSPAAAAALMAVGLLCGYVYLQRQRRLAVPLFPIDLLRIPLFSLSICTSVTSFASQTLAFIALPFLFLDVWGRSPVEAGLLMAAWPLSVLCVAPVVGRLIGRYHGGLLGGLGLATMALGMALLAVLAPAPSLADIAWRMAVCGAGFGLFQSPNNHTIFTSAPVQRSGAAGGMLASARLTGQALGAVLLVAVFSLAGPLDKNGPALALLAAAVLAAVASVFSALRLRHAATAV
jgi:DHA2 family multidrug resistance protein-like MFS transporter